MRQIVWIMAMMAIISQNSCAKPTYYGVVIGCCGQYKNGGLDALHAKDDAQMFYNDLIERYYQGSTNRAKGKLYLLTERKATRANIKSKLKEVTQKANAGDFLYFFYSGHGSSLSDDTLKITENNTEELMKLMENSGLILPYDFNRNRTTKTAIIGSRDLKENGGYGFKRLDSNGVQVIMISDSCYAGNIYRNSPNSTKKFVPKRELKGIEDEFDAIDQQRHKRRKKERDDYSRLIFFGAGAMDTTVSESWHRKRGKFSLVVEKCLNEANINHDNKITNQEFRECLGSEDNTKGFVYYPNSDQRANSVVFRTVAKKIQVQPKDLLRIKSSLPSVEGLDGVVIDNKNYEIEIADSGNGEYTIFRYTGEVYAIIKHKYLKTYIQSYKLFKLKGRGKLTLSAQSLVSQKEESLYCKGEEIMVDIKERNIGKYIVALTLNKEGGVIMLQPNDYSDRYSLNIVQTVVQKPFGMDKIKVFALNSKEQYDQVKTLVEKGGLLEGYGVQKLYTILKSNPSYQEAQLDIETIGREIEQCKKGKR